MDGCSDDASADNDPDLSARRPYPIDIYYSSHPHIRLQECPGDKGKGLFAVAPIEEGEEVWAADPQSHPTGKVWRLPEDALNEDLEWLWHWAYRCGENECFGPRDRDDPLLEATYYQNHSCDPTTWWATPFVLVARRRIEAGEEITYDYATSECEDEELGLSYCECESPLCRKILRGEDYLNPDLIERYGSHFMPYLIQRQQLLGLNLSAQTRQASPTH